MYPIRSRVLFLFDTLSGQVSMGQVQDCRSTSEISEESNQLIKTGCIDDDLDHFVCQYITYFRWLN